MRIIVTPQEEQVSIKMPKEFVGKRVEVSYKLADEKPEKDDLPSLESLIGTISPERLESWHEHIRQVRSEWD